MILFSAGTFSAITFENDICKITKKVAIPKIVLPSRPYNIDNKYQNAEAKKSSIKQNPDDGHQGLLLTNYKPKL